MADREYQTGDDSLLKEICEFRDYSWSRSQKNRKEGDEDMKALSVIGPMPTEERDARIAAKRPCGHTDIISPYNNRIVNQARMNPRGVEVIPSGDGASKKTAEKRENRMRAIDYESKAHQADLTALQNAVDRGYGYERVDLEFVSPRLKNLRIVVKRIPNPNCILDDPDCQDADRSDRKALIIGQWIRVTEAKRRWKKLKDRTPENFSMESLQASSAWERPGQMFFAEFWKVIEKYERLLYFNGSSEGVFESELEKQGLTLQKIEAVDESGKAASIEAIVDASGQVFPVEDERDGVIKSVMQYFTNGLQIFEEKPWPGSWIPFPCCFGREKYEGEDLVIESMTRKLREPNLNFDVATAGEMEEFGSSTKTKILVSDKAIVGYEEQWKIAHRNPQAFLKYHERDEEGKDVTQPKEVRFEAHTDAFEIARNSFIRDAQNAAGMVGVDQKQRETQSGVAQDRIDEASDISSFHFMDSYLNMVEFRGRIENELLSIIEDSRRQVGFRSKDGKYKSEQIEPLDNGQHPYGDAGSHGVTISTGPNYKSQMEKSQKFLADTASRPEFLANPMAPLIIEAMNVGPLTDKMKQIATSVQPPQVQAIYAQDDGDESDPVSALSKAQQDLMKAQADLSALNQHAKTLETQVIELQEDIKAQKIKADSDERMAQEANRVALLKTQADNDTKLELERMKESHELEMKRLEIELKALDESEPDSEAFGDDSEDQKTVVRSLISSHKEEIEKLKAESGVEQVRSEFERSREELQQTKDELVGVVRGELDQLAQGLAQRTPSVKNFERDEQGRIARIVSDNGESAAVERDADGRIVKVVPETP